ncbi:MAG: hypothetical protein OEM59_01145 [Rhodospirillales bacterium]|nr:hypothetical protein [Rhodospirillales bacterium]
MRTLLAATFLSLALAAPALAGQCPADMKKIDAALAASPDLTAEQLAEVSKLRTEGEAQHKGGQHKESVETLAKAKEILGID